MVVSQVVFLSRACGCALSRENYKWRRALFGDNSYISDYVKYLYISYLTFSSP